MRTLETEGLCLFHVVSQVEEDEIEEVSDCSQVT
jgi:hypothetical protein